MGSSVNSVWKNGEINIITVLYAELIQKKNIENHCEKIAEDEEDNYYVFKLNYIRG